MARSRTTLVAMAAAVCAVAAHGVATGQPKSDATATSLKLVDEYVQDYEARYDVVKAQTDASAKSLIGLLETTPGFLVPPEVTYRTKAPASLRGKLVARVQNGESTFVTLQDVGKDVWDIIGVRVTSFTPSVDLPLVEGLLNKTFKMTVWKRGDPNGLYPGNNYRGTYNGISVEVQTRGALDHAMLQVQHKVRAGSWRGGGRAWEGGGSTQDSRSRVG
jgi:ppGpp synthetase/RelA/SpoT-type nucleotidyltranferase